MRIISWITSSLLHINFTIVTTGGFMERFEYFKLCIRTAFRVSKPRTKYSSDSVKVRGTPFPISEIQSVDVTVRPTCSNRSLPAPTPSFRSKLPPTHSLTVYEYETSQHYTSDSESTYSKSPYNTLLPALTSPRLKYLNTT